MNRLLAMCLAATLATAGVLAQDKSTTPQAPSATAPSAGATPAVVAGSKAPEKRAEKTPKPRKAKRVGKAASGAR
jgi:hypothetical protein